MIRCGLRQRETFCALDPRFSPPRLHRSFMMCSNHQPAIFNSNLNIIPITDIAIEQSTCNTILHFVLDHAFERTSTELWIIALVSQQILGGICETQRNVTLSQTWSQTIKLDLHNSLDLLLANLVEDDHFVDTVDKLRSETFFAQPLTNCALYTFLIHVLEL